MQEVIAQEQNSWLQLYVDAMTEKNPYKRLELVRRLREVPRRDESDEAPERPRLKLVPRPQILKPAPPKSPSPVMKVVAPSRDRTTGNRKTKANPKSRRSSRLRSA
jgi:hypothetical protein